MNTVFVVMFSTGRDDEQVTAPVMGFDDMVMADMFCQGHKPALESADKGENDGEVWISGKKYSCHYSSELYVVPLPFVVRK